MKGPQRHANVKRMEQRCCPICLRLMRLEKPGWVCEKHGLQAEKARS